MFEHQFSFLLESMFITTIISFSFVRVLKDGMEGSVISHSLKEGWVYFTQKKFDFF